MTHKEQMEQIEANRQREINEVLQKQQCSDSSDCNKDCENCCMYYNDFTKGN